MDIVYDYLIIGGGPTGLTLAYLLGKLKKKCLLIDQNASLGGCHRVTRVKVNQEPEENKYQTEEENEGLFTEHGPRIYSTSYRNTISLLKEMGWNWDDLFTLYNFSIGNLSGKTISHFNLRELLLLSLEFSKLIFFPSPKSLKHTSVKEFATKNKFSDEAQEYLDRICRLTDGSGSDRYTLFEFLSLINQQGFYKIYQPRIPNDEGLFKIWEENILSTGYVTILKKTKVLKIIPFSDEVKSIIITTKSVTSEIFAKNFIFCIPPFPYENILKYSNTRLMNSYPNFPTFVKNNNYNTYTPITFHFDKKLKLPKIWGFPLSDWGVAFIILSDYMKFKEKDSETVISTCVTIQDQISKFTGKTANQTPNKDELISEVLRQLRISYPDLPNPTYSILHPGVYYDNKEKRWIETDTAYVETYHQEFLPSQNPIFKNLYFVGTQNGDSKYNFTSMESAVSNALSTLHQLEPSSKKTHPIKGPFEVGTLIRIIIILIILFIVFNLIFKKRKKFQIKF